MRHDLVVFGIAATLRLAFVWGQTRYAWFDMSFVAADSVLYRQLADGLARGDGFVVNGHPTAFVTPGYPLFLAGLSLVGVRSPEAVGFVQALLDAVTCVLIGRIAGKIAGARAGLAAGLVAALYPHFIFWSGYMLTETVFVFLTVASLLVLVELVDRRSLRAAALAGMLLGFAALARPLILAFALLTPLWMAVAFRVPVSRRLALATAVIIGLALPLGGWAVRNARALGAPVLTSTESGFVFYQGNSPGATGGSRGYVDHRDFARLEVPPGLSEVELDRYHWKRAMEFLASHPEAVPGLAARKLANMWRPTYADASLRNRVVLGGSYIALMVLGGVGIVRSLPDLFRRPAVVLLLVFLAVFVAQHAIITGMIRFRLPLEAVLAVFAGIGIDAGLDRFGRGTARAVRHA
jgi:4-amino-4-deoxy-L-arabinose transferase-like glycosyltransferase